MQLGQASIPVPGFGTLLVNPAFLSILVLSPFDATLVSNSPFPIPNDLGLCGSGANFQALFLDAGAADGIAHTNGLDWVLGGLY